jgi:hypothetical protein
MREGLVHWMESKQLTSIDEVRGRIDVHTKNASLEERANYIRTLLSWTDGT